MYENIAHIVYSNNNNNNTEQKQHQLCHKTKIKSTYEPHTTTVAVVDPSATSMVNWNGITFYCDMMNELQTLTIFVFFIRQSIIIKW